MQSSQFHIIYVKLVPRDDEDVISKTNTLKLLRYVHSRLPLIKQMGITIRIVGIKPKDLLIEEVTTALQKKNIGSLPALCTPAKVYIGTSEIVKTYETNIQRFSQLPEAAPPPKKCNNLDDYLNQVIREDIDDKEDNDESISQSSNLMNSFREMDERRKVNGQHAVSEDQHDQNPTRADNVNPRGDNANSRNPITAPTSSDGDDFDKDGRDDAMELALLARLDL